MTTARAQLNFVGIRFSFGDDGRADWAMAEFYTMQKQPQKACEYARRAKTRLSHDAPEYIKSDDILNQKK